MVGCHKDISIVLIFTALSFRQSLVPADFHRLQNLFFNHLHIIPSGSQITFELPNPLVKVLILRADSAQSQSLTVRDAPFGMKWVAGRKLEELMCVRGLRIEIRLQSVTYP